MVIDIANIAEQLNDVLSDSSMAEFQVERAARLGKSKPGARNLFSKRTTHDNYAYHDGGRSELQFNFGMDSPTVFRYGIGISLQKDRSLPNPIGSMSGRIRKINELVAAKPDLLHGLQMWRNYGTGKGAPREAGRIPDHWITKDSFIFIGERKETSARRYNPSERDIAKIAALFERLYPIYISVENDLASDGRYRAARIVWNDAGWKRPSGPNGKLKRRKNFEYINGFGLEEWIFCDARDLQNWRYSFLQCFSHHHTAYSGRNYDVLLYSIDNRSKRRVWVGRMANVHCLTESSSKKVLAEYRNRGWLEEMSKEVEFVGGNPTHLFSEKPINIINCKFRPSNLEIFDEPMPEIANNDVYLKAFYYDTFTKIPPTRFFSPEPNDQGLTTVAMPTDLSDYGSQGITKRRTATWNTPGDAIQAELRHKSWQKQVLRNLRKRYGKKSVGIEVPTGGGYADIAVRVRGRMIIIELKTGSSARQNVTEALGQAISMDIGLVN